MFFPHIQRGFFWCYPIVQCFYCVGFHRWFSASFERFTGKALGGSGEFRRGVFFSFRERDLPHRKLTTFRPMEDREWAQKHTHTHIKNEWKRIVVLFSFFFGRVCSGHLWVNARVWPWTRSWNRTRSKQKQKNAWKFVVCFFFVQTVFEFLSRFSTRWFMRRVAVCFCRVSNKKRFISIYFKN